MSPAASPYFDRTYFDPTYFDTDTAPAVSTGGKGGKGGRYRPIPVLEPVPVPAPVDDDEDALFASGTI